MSISSRHSYFLFIPDVNVQSYKSQQLDLVFGGTLPPYPPLDLLIKVKLLKFQK